MKILAIVMTCNRLKLLKKNIGALRRQQNLDQTVVVNNGNNDGTKEWLDGQHDLHVIHQKNAGDSGGFHTDIQVAYDEGTDWIWCVDDDVFPKDGCLDGLLSLVAHEEIQLDRKKPLGIPAPRQVVNRRTFTHEFRRCNLTNPLGSLHTKKLSSEEATPTEIVGCDFEGPFISWSAVEEIRLLNRELFIFYDDAGYCLRAHLASFRLFYVLPVMMDEHAFFSEDSWAVRNQKKKWKRCHQMRNSVYLSHHYDKN